MALCSVDKLVVMSLPVSQNLGSVGNTENEVLRRPGEVVLKQEICKFRFVIKQLVLPGHMINYITPMKLIQHKRQ